MYFEKLRKLREEKGYTQACVADFLKVKCGTYGDYESGKEDIAATHLITLCELYDVSSDYILGLSRERGKFLKR